MRLEFDPTVSALPFVEKDIVKEITSSEAEKMLRDGVRAAQEGRRAEARKTLLQVTEMDADNENAWLWLASISEYPEELLVFLNNVLRINPQNERALEWHKATKSLLAKTLVQRGIEAIGDNRQIFARQCFEQALEHEAENEMAWLWMASVADSDEEKAGCFEKVLAVNPDNTDARTSLEAIHSQKTQAMLREALAAAFEGRHADAHEMIDAVLERSAEMEDAWVLKSHIAASFEERAECFLKLRALNPENKLANAALASWKSLAEKRGDRREIEKPALDTTETIEEAAPVDFTHEPTAELNEPTPHLDEPAAELEESLSEEAYGEQQMDQTEQFDAEQSLEFGDTQELPPLTGNSTEIQSFAASFEPAEVEIIKDEEETAEAVAACEAPETVREESSSEPLELESGDSDDVLEEFNKLQSDLATELEENDMNWAFNQTAPPSEVEDYFRDFDEEDIHRTQTVEAGENFASNFEAENLTPELSVEAENTVEIEVEAENAIEMQVEDAPEAQPEEWRGNSPQFFVENAPEAFEAPSAVPENDFYYEPAVGSQEDAPVESVRLETAEAEQPAEVYAAASEEMEAPKVFAEYTYLQQFTENKEESLPVEEGFGLSEPAAETAADPAANEVSLEFDETPASTPQEEFPQPPKSEILLCPFCHAENEKQSYACASCRTILTLSDLEMLLNQISADVDKLAPAIVSLESENQSYGLNAEQLANLGVGHINLKNFRQGFHYLQEAVRKNPSNVILDAQVNALAIRLTEIEEQQTAHESMVKNRRILVVDDSPTVRKLISGKLEKCGHEVICAVDGLDALQKIGEATPDLILLDITMPRMDGYQVCKMIRGNETTKDVPVVMISGKDGFFDKVRGRMAGTTGYITKPFGPETLMKTVETYL